MRACPLWQEMKSHPALVICVGASRRWFPPHHWPLPVMKLLRLSPLRGSYSSLHRCDERLELLDTHHTFTPDSRGSHCWAYRPSAPTPPSTSFPNDRLRRDTLFRPSGCSITGYLRRSDALVSQDDVFADSFTEWRSCCGSTAWIIVHCSELLRRVIAHGCAV